MSSKLLPSLFAFTLTALVLPATAQVAATQPQPKRHPYTAEFEVTRIQTLANGTTITNESRETMAHDSAGRFMSSTTRETPGMDGQPWTSGSASDPAASTQTLWNSQTKKATVAQYPAKDQQHGCWANEAGNFTANYSPVQKQVTQERGARPEQKIEDLGTTTILGIEVKGHRITRTIPAGQDGNDQPIVTTDESWVSLRLGLGLALKEVREDPRSGKYTRELTSLTLGEPDPAIFQPPDGYEVKTDELHQVDCPQ